MQICLCIAFRYKLKFSRLNSLYSRLCHLVHSHKPLRLYKRLYNSLTSVMSAYIMAVRNHLYQETCFFKILYYKFSCLISVKSVILASRHINSCIIMHYINFTQIMSLSYLEVIRIMCRCYLYTSCSELFVNIFIRYYRYFSSYKR